jgi:hypothetical protein
MPLYLAAAGKTGHDQGQNTMASMQGKTSKTLAFLLLSAGRRTGLSMLSAQAR